MNVVMAGLSLALMLGADSAPDANPLSAFLHAADVNDRAGMKAVLDGGGSAFLKKIDGCYLRRVYVKDDTKEIIAAWMCAEGPNRSRVVLADVGLTRGDKVAVFIQYETTNDRPAPERAGSAFAD